MVCGWGDQKHITNLGSSIYWRWRSSLGSEAQNTKGSTLPCACTCYWETLSTWMDSNVLEKQTNHVLIFSASLTLIIVSRVYTIFWKMHFIPGNLLLYHFTSFYPLVSYTLAVYQFAQIYHMLLFPSVPLHCVVAGFDDNPAVVHKLFFIWT